MSEAESNWVKSWLASVSIVMLIQAGTLVWFLAKLDSRLLVVERDQERVETLWEHYIRGGGDPK
jgi:hypothetical protein